MHSTNIEIQGSLTGATTPIKHEFKILFGLMSVKDWCGVRRSSSSRHSQAISLGDVGLKSCVKSIILSHVHSFSSTIE